MFKLILTVALVAAVSAKPQQQYSRQSSAPSVNGFQQQQQKQQMARTSQPSMQFGSAPAMKTAPQFNPQAQFGQLQMQQQPQQQQQMFVQQQDVAQQQMPDQSQQLTSNTDDMSLSQSAPDQQQQQQLQQDMSAPLLTQAQQLPVRQQQQQQQQQSSYGQPQKPQAQKQPQQSVAYGQQPQQKPQQKVIQQTTTTTTTTTPASFSGFPNSVNQAEICLGQLPGDILPDTVERKSNQFIQCTENGGWSLMMCPSPLVFNTNNQKCEHSLRAPLGCLSNPCQNGAKCVDMPNFTYQCQCAIGFAGDLCDRLDVCREDTCGKPNSLCIPLAPGSPTTHYCICDGMTTFGLDCVSSFEQNQCLNGENDRQALPTQHNPAIYVQCEGNTPHMFFCSYPLVFNTDKQQCDWSMISPAPVLVTPAPIKSTSQYSSSSYSAAPALPQQAQQFQTIQQVRTPSFNVKSTNSGYGY